MRRAHGEVEKERFIRCGGTLFEILDGFRNHDRLVFDRLHVLDDSVLLDDGLDVAGVGEAVEVVEADRVGTPGHLVADFQLVFYLGLAFLLGLTPFHAEVPLADAGGVVTIVLQERGDGETRLRNQGRGEGIQHSVLANPVRVATSHKTIAGRRATGGGGVPVGEAHAFLGHTVDVWCLEEAVGTITGWLAVTHVVEENENNIRSLNSRTYRRSK